MSVQIQELGRLSKKVASTSSTETLQAKLRKMLTAV